jgi:hypothetical protein
MSIVELIREELAPTPDPDFAARPIEVHLDKEGEVHLDSPPANDTTPLPRPEDLN